MRAILGVLAMCSGLAGCMVMPVETQLPSKASATPRNEVAMEKAMMFVTVSDDVEPFVERICRQTDPYRNCDFLIVVDDTPRAPANAYQTVDRMGRPVIAFTIALLADIRNKDEFAFVLAHEASHHIAGHLERTQRNAAIGATVFGELAGAAGSGIPADVERARQLGAQVASRVYSKDYELEADVMAAKIVTAAGYDAMLGAEFFFRIPDPGDQFLGSHPANADRYNAVARAVGR